MRPENDSVPDEPVANDRTSAFIDHRPLLFSIAYRMLGTVTEAEDVVQETFLRWSTAKNVTVESPRSYLASIVTRLCIDHMRSARVQRETYVGPWLPEPYLIERELPVDDSVVLSESLTLAFLTLLERLSPVERAVLLLRNVFGFEYAEISRIVDRKVANCRQIRHRAQQRLTVSAPRNEPPSPEQRKITQRFVDATTNGDVEGLLTLLDEESTLWSDGGEKVLAARHPVQGATSVANFLVGISRHESREIDTTVVWVNRQPGVLVHVDEELIAVVALDIVDGRISGIRIVRNPDKLGAISNEPKATL